MLTTLGTVFTGSLFAIGLIVSGMANPAKVQNFLDLFGTWDPSLAFVMGGAILVAMPVFQYVARRQTRTVDNKVITLPTSTTVDPKLVLGAAIFGIGWGIGGVCPAPAFTLLEDGKGAVFLGAMVLGALLEGVASRKRD